MTKNELSKRIKKACDSIDLSCYEGQEGGVEKFGPALGLAETLESAAADLKRLALYINRAVANREQLDGPVGPCILY